MLRSWLLRMPIENRCRYPGIEVEYAKHLHAVLADGVLFGDHTDVAEAEGFDQHLDNFGMRYRPVCVI